MVNRSSALESNYPVGINVPNNKSRLQLSEIKNLQLTQVAAWPDFINKVGSDIANHLRRSAERKNPSVSPSGNQLCCVLTVHPSDLSRNAFT